MTNLPNTEIILQLLLSAGTILICAKFFGVLVRKAGIPQDAAEAAPAHTAAVVPVVPALPAAITKIPDTDIQPYRMIITKERNHDGKRKTAARRRILKF